MRKKLFEIDFFDQFAENNQLKYVKKSYGKKINDEILILIYRVINTI